MCEAVHIDNAENDGHTERYPLLSFPGWIELLDKYREEKAADFALKFGGRSDWPVKALAEQLHCYPRAEEKLGPLHCNGMIYLREALEQASGYTAAMHRANAWKPEGMGRTTGFQSDIFIEATDSENPETRRTPLVVDLAGGLGIDAAAWASSGVHVIYNERNRMLAEIAQHNHRQLGFEDRMDHHVGDAKAWLVAAAEGRLPKPDLVYLDPSRRAGGRRVISLDDCEPRLTELIPLLRMVAPGYLVKLSPMLDISQLQNKLPDCRTITVVSVDGEVKELLADCSTERKIGSKKQRPVRKAVMLNPKGDAIFELHGEDDSLSRPAGSGPPATYLFEADPALFKADLINETAEYFGLRRIHPQIGYLTGRSRIKDFPGRTYRIREILPYKPRRLRQYLSENRLRKVHIHQRGFPLSVDQLFHKLGCSMGEEAHLIATTNHQGAFIIIVADM